MGRSVSYPKGAEVTFAAPAFLDYEVGAVDAKFDYFDFYDLVDDARATALAAWPSMYEVDKWLDREDHALTENAWAYFGVSGYGSVVAYWLVAKEQDNNGRQALAEQWVAVASTKLKKTFGTLRRVGVMSNGEALYERTT